MTQPARIVVRSVNWLGDAIMSTPALMALRAGFPSAEISIVTPEKLKDLWAHHPAIDHILPFHSDEGSWQVGQKIFRQQFDLSVIFPNSFRTGLEMFLGRVPRRVGYEGQLRTKLLTHPVARPESFQGMQKLNRDEVIALNQGRAARAVEYSRESHHIRHYLHLASACGVEAPVTPPRLCVTAEEQGSFVSKFQIVTGKLLLGLNAGAEYGPAKRWPADRFIEAVIALSKAIECDWLIFGAKSDEPLVDTIVNAAQRDIRGGSRLHKLAGRTNLRELCVGLSLCKVLLTNDTGPMHVAAAVGTRVVVPFGSTSPELTGPDPLGTTDHKIIRAGVPCSPCFLRECPIDFRCMLGISVHSVVDAMIEAARAPQLSCTPLQN